jgi:hypothetical protein
LILLRNVKSIKYLGLPVIEAHRQLLTFSVVNEVRSESFFLLWRRRNGPLITLNTININKNLIKKHGK